MKVNFDTTLVTLDGKPIEDGDKDLTLKTACVNALTLDQGSVPGQPTDSGPEKFRRYELARKIHGAVGEVDLASDEVVCIKAAVAKTYITLIVGQAFNLLEGKCTLAT